MQEFTGKVAVVTGGASGIGFALAETFAKEGMKVILADIEEAALTGAVAKIIESGGEAIGVVTDVSDEAAVEALAQRTIDKYGAIHILCNNAGVAGDLDFTGRNGSRVWEHSMKDWNWAFGVNFWGVVYGLRAFVPLMLTHGEPGHIVNTASQAGLLAGATADIYGATKFGVVRITEALYHQLVIDEAQISASVLCPGIIKTRIASSGRNRRQDQSDKELIGGDELTAQAEAADEMWAAIPGLEPSEVSEQVLQSIKDKQLYILTRDVPFDAVSRRTQHIVDGTNPETVAPLMAGWRQND